MCVVHFYKGVPTLRSSLSRITLCIGLVVCAAILVKPTFRTLRPMYPQQMAPIEASDQSPISAGIEGNTKPNIRVESTLVLIPVSVVDPLYRFVSGLRKENFRLFEDRIEQTILNLSVEEAPASIGLIVDRSGSMQDKLGPSGWAVSEFLKTANPEDEFFLVLFSDRPELAVPFTNRTDEIQDRLLAAEAEGSTALLDAIYMGLHRIRYGRETRKALLIISDGGENSSRFTEREVIRVAQEADAQIFAIGIYKRLPASPQALEDFSGKTLLTRIAEVTGGFQYPVQAPSEFPAVAAKISNALRNQYVLAYTSTNQQRDGKYRLVSVRVMQPTGSPPLRAYWRAGYYAPNSLN